MLPPCILHRHTAFHSNAVMVHVHLLAAGGDGEQDACGDRHSDEVVDERPTEIEVYATEDDAGEIEKGEDSCETRVDEDEGGRREGNVRTRADCYAEVGGGESGCVVNAVAYHGNSCAFLLLLPARWKGDVEYRLVWLGEGLLEVLNLLGFLVWEDAGNDVGSWDADLRAYSVGCSWVVTR